MKKVVTYRDPLAIELPAQNHWLSEAVYQEVVRSTIVTCVDVVITVIGKPQVIWLAKRNVNPLQGLWFIGGRAQFASDSMAGAIAQNVERETSVVCDSERFQLLTVNDYTFAQAAQGNFPCRSLALLYHLEVSEAEHEAMSTHLVASEYEIGFGLQAFSREQLTEARVHPAVLDAFDLIWSK